MKNYLVLAGLFLFSACQSPEIAQDKVVETLRAFGQKNPETRLRLHTGAGDLLVKLYAETPLHRANFLRLVRAGYYADREFYRIVSGVAVQGGGGQADPLHYTVPAEFRPSLIHKRGALAMARYSEQNPGKASSPSEFFIVTKGRFYDPDELTKYPAALRDVYLKQGGEILYDGEYTVFGEVTAGFEVLDQLARQPLTEGDKPLRAVKFSVQVVE